MADVVDFLIFKIDLVHDAIKDENFEVRWEQYRKILINGKPEHVPCDRFAEAPP